MNFKHLIITLVILAAAIGAWFGSTVAAQPNNCSCHENLLEQLPTGHFKLPPNSRLQICLNCHRPGSEQSLSQPVHLNHYSNTETTFDCLDCHELTGNTIRLQTGLGEEHQIDPEKLAEMNTYFVSWATSGYLDSILAQHGVSCGECHDTYTPEKKVKKDKCLSCHGSYEEVAALTADVEPNPHDSHLIDVECGICHKVHEPSTLYCNMCHYFDLQMPSEGGPGGQ